MTEFGGTASALRSLLTWMRSRQDRAVQASSWQPAPSCSIHGAASQRRSCQHPMLISQGMRRAMRKRVGSSIRMHYSGLGPIACYC